MLELCATSLFGLSVISPLVNLPNWTRVETVFVLKAETMPTMHHIAIFWTILNDGLSSPLWVVKIEIKLSLSGRTRNQTSILVLIWILMKPINTLHQASISILAKMPACHSACVCVCSRLHVLHICCTLFFFSTSTVYKHIRPHLVFLPLIWFFLLLIWSNSPLAFPVSSPLGWRTTSPVTMQYRHVTRPNATHVIIKYRARHNESSTVTHRALSAKLQTRVTHKTPTGFAENEGVSNYFALWNYINSIYSI